MKLQRLQIHLVTEIFESLTGIIPQIKQMVSTNSGAAGSTSPSTSNKVTNSSSTTKSISKPASKPASQPASKSASKPASKTTSSQGDSQSQKDDNILKDSDQKHKSSSIGNGNRYPKFLITIERLFNRV